MICHITKSPQDECATIDGTAPSDKNLITRALAIYMPDLGLAIHRALEARQVLEEGLESPILDLGCGDGRFARLWMGDVFRTMLILGCDLSPIEVKHAITQGRLKLALAADGRHLPLKDGCIATVIANSVLTHVPDIDRLIAEVSRILRSNGKFLASVPGPAFENQFVWVRVFRSLGIPWLAQRIGDRYHLSWHQWHRDGEIVWNRRFANHGLSLLKARPYPGKKTGLIWSLAFTVMRVGIGRLSLLSILNKLRLSTSFWSRSSRLARILSPLLSEDETPGGSLFLVARKTGTSRSSSSHHTLPPRVPPTTILPDLNSLLKWLSQSKILISNEAQVMTGGYGNFIDGRTGRSPMLYSEITGYATQFWLRQKQKDALSRAINAGDCLLRIQANRGEMAGAFPYGLSRPEGNPIPAFFSFDAGICASALIELALRTGENRFAEGAKLAGSFLNLMQNEDGSFNSVQLKPGHPNLPVLEKWFLDRCALHGKNAIALLKLWHLTGHEHWKDAACRTLDWVCTIQGLRGDFPQWQMAPLCMTHTHCYATEGLLYAGLILDNDRYLTAGIRGAEWLRMAQRRSGALYRNYTISTTGSPQPAKWLSHLHVGPVAQAARIWWVACQITPGRPWTEAAARALVFLSKVQEIWKNPTFCGAFPHSVRIFGLHRRKNTHYSPWEAMFAYEAVRLWTTGNDELTWSIF